MPDLMDRLQEFEAQELEATQLRGRLPDVAVPIARSCDYCDEAIAPARLRAVPTATHCIGCEELRVQREHFAGRPRA